MKKIAVGILGATGMVGQQYLQLLSNHPWFEVTFLAASQQSSEKKYREAVQGRWNQHQPLPEKFIDFPVHSIANISQAAKDCKIVFSAITSQAAEIYEEQYAAAGLAVLSNVSHHRHTQDVAVLIPEINADHLEIIHVQRKKRGWNKGFIVTKPNCSIQSYMIPLDPLHHKYKIKKMAVTTMQAISGAGYPGVSSMDIHDNIIPYIEGEELKSEREPLKIWGHIQNDQIHYSQDMVISAHCNRVGVLDGHMACVSVEFAHKPQLEEILRTWNSYESLPQQLKLPSSPVQTIVYKQENNRPQPRLDRMEGSGMSITIGRLRECPLLHYRFTSLSHNTIRGAAGGGILNAELLYKKGFIS